MNFKKSILKICLISTLFSILTSVSYVGASNSSSDLKVFIKDEGFHEKNIVKPRIYVENRGRRMIKSFELCYYFTVENHKSPVLENYYTPGGRVTLEKLSNRDYCVSYRFLHVNLKPGDAYPNRDGFIVGIHYPDWSEMNKNNDYSDPGSPNWHPTRKVKAIVLGGGGNSLNNDDDDENLAPIDRDRNPDRDQNGSSLNLNININKK